MGDANLAEVATFLKVGTTALVLALIEDDAFDGRRPGPGQSRPGHPPGRRSTSPCPPPVDMADGRTTTALALQWELFGLARKYAEDRGLACLGDETVGQKVLQRWEDVLHGLETDPIVVAGPGRLGGQAPAARGLPRAPRAGLGRPPAGGRGPPVPRPAPGAVAVRPARHRAPGRPSRTCSTAVTEPPRRTRAYFRGQCLKRWASAVASANWDSLVFDLGTDPLRRVPMMDPLRGTAEHVEELLKECSTPAELLARLSG